MHSPSRRGDGHLWMIALAFSLLANGALVGFLGLAALESKVWRKNLQDMPPPPTESVVMVFPELAEVQAPAKPASGMKESAPVIPPVAREKSFARTSADQTAPPENKNTAFIGERDTLATSDRAPDAAAPALPSQAGIDPRDGEIETTRSTYQDGRLSAGSDIQPVIDPAPVAQSPAPPTPQDPAAATETSRMDKPETPGTDSEFSAPPVREKLMEGPNPVDVAVPREISKPDHIKTTPEKRPTAETPAPPESPKPDYQPKIAELPRPKPPTDPAFRGFQRKTAVIGSISRTGRSALDVVDSPLGRYQAAISRAVELEFQRNCVRHRDFITPGFLTVRFFIEPGGRVRSVSFDGDMSTGEIQKGFTLNSIRNAEIPPMPPSLRNEYAKEPLELVFRFYF
jgi:hypothetical protein